MPWDPALDARGLSGGLGGGLGGGGGGELQAKMVLTGNVIVQLQHHLHRTLRRARHKLERGEKGEEGGREGAAPMRQQEVP